jgi:hypothetical protein
MAKKIERSRVEAGKAELPRKLEFLSTEKVDYLLVLERDGDFSVEVPAGALAKLVKSRGELKAMKAAQKQALAAATSALAAEREAHQSTHAALAKAERRIKALEKKLEANVMKLVAANPVADVPTPAAAPAARKARAVRKTAKSMRPKNAAVDDTGSAATSAVAGAATLGAPAPADVVDITVPTAATAPAHEAQ